MCVKFCVPKITRKIVSICKVCYCEGNLHNINTNIMYFEDLFNAGLYF